MWNWLKGLLGNYQGRQFTKPLTPIVEKPTPATVSNILQIPAIWECVNKITKAMSCLPCDVLQVVDDDGNTELVEKVNAALAELLQDDENGKNQIEKWFEQYSVVADAEEAE